MNINKYQRELLRVARFRIESDLDEEVYSALVGVTGVDIESDVPEEEQERALLSALSSALGRGRNVSMMGAWIVSEYRSKGHSFVAAHSASLQDQNGGCNGLFKLANLCWIDRMLYIGEIK